MKWKPERRPPIQWDEGEREKLIEAALARGELTRLPAAKAETEAERIARTEEARSAKRKPT